MKVSRFYILWFILMLLMSLSLIGCSECNPCKKANFIQTESVLKNYIEMFDTIQLNRATTYQPTIAQCDSNPLTTADGSKIDPNNLQKWVALSRDLLKRWGGEFDYGDTLEIYSKEHANLNGEWIVHDCMNAKYKMSIDFLMSKEDNLPKLGVGTDVKIICCSTKEN